ncbi:MAG TPA: hypothetical protein VK789_13520 [Bryobacteraceae bacterium]|nr:hypothetical protein [Bryobacteraceae bacterium]
MRTILLCLALSLTSLAQPTPDIEVVVPPSAAHPQDWLRPRIRENPKPAYPGTSAHSLAEFVAPEVISRIVVDQYAGPPDDVRGYLTTLPTAIAQYFGPSLVLCKARAGTTGSALAWTSTSTVTFESGRRGKLAIATVFPGAVTHYAVPAPAGAPGCFGTDKIPFDSLYVSYVDPDGYSWYFALPLQRKN